MAVRYPFNMGPLGYYQHSKAKSPFRIGKTLSQPPERWTLTNDLRTALFASLAKWFVEWERKYKVGTDPETGESIYEVRPNHFARCARCKQEEKRAVHWIEPPDNAELVGPYCASCCGIVLSRTFTTDTGESPDMNVYTINVDTKSLSGYIHALKQTEAVETVEDSADENLF